MATSGSHGDVSQSQQEIITSMEEEVHRYARMGRFDWFQTPNELILDQLLTPNKNTIIHVYITSCTTDEKEFVEKILNICPRLLFQSNADGETPLHLAARYGHAQISELLVERARAGPVRDGDRDLESGDAETRLTVAEMLRQTTTSEKNTALHEAVRFNHLSIVQMLIKEDPDFEHPANEAQETPFYLAVDYGHLDVVREMLANCSQLNNVTGPDNRTALHAAVILKKKVMIKEILQKMAYLTREADDKGYVPLHYAVELNYTDIMRMLLREDKSAAYCKDKEGKTPLHIAASGGNTRMIEDIFQACPDCFELVDNMGQNVLHYIAKSKDEYQIIATRVILNEPSLCYLINQKDNEGNAPLLLFDESHIPKALLSHPRMDKRTFNKQNQNALDVALGPAKRVWKWARLEAGLSRQGLRRSFRKQFPKEEVTEEGTKVVSKISDKDVAFRVDQIQAAILVIAALIATVTFTAGFTIPGGFTSNGSAVLRKNKVFQAFLFIDMIALTLSTRVVISQIYLAVERKRSIVTLTLHRSLVLLVLAMIAMVLAFITGVYAVLEPSYEFLIVLFIISILFFTLAFAIAQYLSDRIERRGTYSGSLDKWF